MKDTSSHIDTLQSRRVAVVAQWVQHDISLEKAQRLCFAIDTAIQRLAGVRQ